MKQKQGHKQQDLLSYVRASLTAVLSALDYLSTDDSSSQVNSVGGFNTSQETNTCSSDVKAGSTSTDSNSYYDINIHFGSNLKRGVDTTSDIKIHRVPRTNIKPSSHKLLPIQLMTQIMPDDIARLEQVLEWMPWLTERERKLVWWRAAKMPWEDICDELNFSHATGWRQWVVALSKISEHLNET